MAEPASQTFRAPMTDIADIEQDDHADIRDAVAKLCAQFPGEYWRKLDREMAYPSAFVDALTKAGYLSVLIPEEYGGAGLKLSAACAILKKSSAPDAMAAAATRRCTPWARCCGTAAMRRKRNGCRKSPAANCGCRRSGSPSRPV